MTYEEFLQLTEKNLKRFFPESFQERSGNQRGFKK